MFSVKRILSIQMKIKMEKTPVKNDEKLHFFLHFLFSSDGKQGKAKRVRTTFTEEQLQILQANFEVDSNPDGQDLERIAQITGKNFCFFKFYSLTLTLIICSFVRSSYSHTLIVF